MTLFYLKKKSNYDKLFDSWKYYFNNYSISLDLFCIAYLEKCKKHGLFNEFAEFYIYNIIFNNNPYVNTFIDLFMQMVLVKVTDKQNNQILFDLWDPNNC